MAVSEKTLNALRKNLDRVTTFATEIEPIVDDFDVQKEKALSRYEAKAEELSDRISAVDDMLSDIRSLPTEAMRAVSDIRIALEDTRRTLSGYLRDVNSVISRLKSCKLYSYADMKGRIDFLTEGASSALKAAESGDTSEGLEEICVYWCSRIRYEFGDESTCPKAPDGYTVKEPVMKGGAPEKKSEKAGKDTAFKRFVRSLSASDGNSVCPRWFGLALIGIYAALCLGLILLESLCIKGGAGAGVLEIFFLLLAIIQIIYSAYFGLIGGMKILTVNRTTYKEVLFKGIGLVMTGAVFFIIKLLTVMLAPSAALSVLYILLVFIPIILIMYFDKISEALCASRFQKLLFTVAGALLLFTSVIIAVMYAVDYAKDASLLMKILYHLTYVVTLLTALRTFARSNKVFGVVSLLLPLVFMCTAIASLGGSVIFIIIDVALLALVGFAGIRR